MAIDQGNRNAEYAEFLFGKTHTAAGSGFHALWMPDTLFDFQRLLVTWAAQMGRCALFADCGLGKTIIQLTWAENIVRTYNARVLIITPLAVGQQTVHEGEKFGVEAKRSNNGTAYPGITVTNYERLHYFTPTDFMGVVCDESSILKNFNGARRALVTEFLRTIRYRLLCTATAAPNDYIELGTSSEALGVLGHMDMLGRFFKNDQHSLHPTSWRHHERGIREASNTWRFKHHAEVPFWRWVCSWARAIRRPSDLECDDGPFTLPQLCETLHVIDARTRREGMLFTLPAIGLQEQREERRRTITERCEMAARLVSATKAPAVLWCHLNKEADTLCDMLPEAQQVSGSDEDEAKEEKFHAFTAGQLRLLIIKPKIGAFGLNWQHCAHMTFFPSHSYEQYYQSVRRCWRFGQTRPVIVDVIGTEGEREVMSNLQRKAKAADQMFTRLVAEMSHASSMKRTNDYLHTEEIPSWL